MIRLIFVFTLLAGSAAAQEVTTDAFGVLPTANLEDRADWAGLRTTSSGKAITQEPQAVDAAIFFVGPKSIVAGIEPGHAVAIGLDAFGNMVDGAPTTLVLGTGATANVATQDGIADLLFTPPPRSGVFLAGADVGGVQSSRADYRVTAHLATVQPAFAAGDNAVLPETFAQISTDVLQDSYGNVVDDGVGLMTIMEDGNRLTTLLPTVVRDGTAQSNLLTRDLSGDVSGSVALAGTRAEGLRFTVQDMVLTDAGAFAIWAEPAINAVHLRIGPMETDAGYLVPDGTFVAVEVVARDRTRQTVTGWVLDGYVSFLLSLAPDSAPFDVALQVGANSVVRRVDVAPRPENLTVRGAE